MDKASIVERYRTPGDPVAYSSAGRVYEDLRKRYGDIVDRDDVERKLSGITTHTLHKRLKKRKKFIPVYVYEKRWLMQADLFATEQLAAQNDNVRHILLVQDTFTRYVWARPLVNKSGNVVLSNFRHILRQTGPIKKLWTDRGTEFVGQTFKKFCQENNITQVFNYTSGHASNVEAAGKSLQRLMYKYMSDKDTERYIDVLALLVKTMNNRHSRGLGGRITPAEAELPENAYYVRGEHEKRYAKVQKPNQAVYAVGQAVRLTAADEDNRFRRSYKEQNTRELYEITSVDVSKKIPLYTLRTYYPVQKLGNIKEDVLGKFYANEIVPVTVQT